MSYLDLGRAGTVVKVERVHVGSQDRRTKEDDGG